MLELVAPEGPVLELDIERVRDCSARNACPIHSLKQNGCMVHALR